MPEQIATSPVYQWGRGDFGQLAYGSDQSASAPQPSSLLWDHRVVSAAANLYNTAVVTGEETCHVLENSGVRRSHLSAPALQNVASMLNNASTTS